MRRVILPFCVIPAMIACMWACTKDAYDKGEGKYSLMQSDFAVAHTDRETHFDYAVTDDGDSLLLTCTIAVNWAAVADTLYRTLLYYDRQPSGTAFVEDAERVYVLQPKDRPDSVEMKTDPVFLQSAWKSNNERFVNFSIGVKTAYVDAGSNVHQSIALIRDTVIVHDNGMKTEVVVLYHDQGGMPEYYTSNFYFSIPADSISADSISVRVNTYDLGIVTKTLPLLFKHTFDNH